MKRSEPLAEVSFVEKTLRKPPLAVLRFDITLRNHFNLPKWILIPTKLNLPTRPLKDGIDRLDLLKVEGERELFVGRFHGTGGFYAVRLPAGAVVNLKNVTMSFWGTVPNEITIEIVIADNITIGGEKEESWFGRDMTWPLMATGDLLDAQVMHSRRTTDHREVRVSAEGEERITLDVNCERENWKTGGQ